MEKNLNSEKSGSFSGIGKRRSHSISESVSFQLDGPEPKECDENQNPAELSLEPDLKHDQILEEVDQFIEKLDSDRGKCKAPEIPNSIEPLLKMVETRIAGYEQREASAKFGQNQEEDPSFFEAISRVSRIVKSLDEFPFDSSATSCFNQAGSVHHRAMLLLEYEFCALLDNSKRICNINRDPKTPQTPKQSFFNSNHELDRCIRPESDSKKEDEFPSFSPESISNMNQIATAMISAGYEAECCISYSGLRLKALDVELNKQGFENINVDDVQRMHWESLEGEIANWIQIVKHCSTNFFSAERKLCNSVFSEHPLIAQRLVGEAAVSIFCQLENSIKSDNGRIPVASGAVHPLTRYTMNYLKYACEYKDTLEQVFQQHYKMEESTRQKFEEQESKNAIKDDGSPRASPFSVKLMMVMDLLDANIDMKSKLYRDPALRYIFLMNNGRYILQKVKGSAEIYEMMGDSWSRKRTTDLRRYHKNYQRETWSKVLQCINHEGLQVNGKVSKTILKERFKNFNTLFDEIHKTQSTWVVSDEQLQSELIVSISAVVIPAYRSFLGRFKSYVDYGRQAEKYIKYQPEDIEGLIDQLFDGNSTSMGRRRT
ncbi:Exocyst complex component Exo70 - like 3 [Theobroma cacao]|nr:Exocyst complex component Exo70 - like 3 [Theobroma cacao]